MQSFNILRVSDRPPTDPRELKFLLLRIHTPAVGEFTGPDGGRTAHYMLRWLSTRGEAGPWSETASATIGAEELSAFSRQLSAGWLGGRFRRWDNGIETPQV